MAEGADQWQDDQEVSDERREVLRWRREWAEKAGLTRIEARLFAEGDGDLAELRYCAEHGATPAQIAAICI